MIEQTLDSVRQAEQNAQAAGKQAAESAAQLIASQRAKAKANAEQSVAAAKASAAEVLAKANAEGAAKAKALMQDAQAELAALRKGAAARQPQAVEQLIHRLLG